MSIVLSARDEPDRALMGGKAWALAELEREFPVPCWFVVTPRAFAGEALEQDAIEEIEAEVAKLGKGLFAVRSSAIEEDALDSSFAGQLESFLEVPSDQVPDRVRAVRDSAFRDSVLAYRRLRGKVGAPSPPAVLVQQMVRADKSGVAFSVDPIDQTSSEVVVAATQGLADQLVGGTEAGDHYRVARDGQVVEKNPTGQEPVLCERELGEVAALAIKAEEHFGLPQDIEWAIEGDKLYIVQSRAITTLRTGDRTIWDNSNIVESYSGVTSPLTFSFARYVYAAVYRAFCSLMGVPRSRIAANRIVFENMLGYVHGHIYYNLLNWYRALALFPGFKANRTFMEQMMGVRKALPADILEQIAPAAPNWAERIIDGLRLARTLVRLCVHALVLQGTMAAFNKRLDRALEVPATPFSAMDLQSLVRSYRDLEDRLLSKWDAPLINDFFCMIAFGLSRKVICRWLGEEAGGALHNHYMIGQGDIISAEPAQRIKSMAARVQGNPALAKALAAGNRGGLSADPELEEQVEAYISKFGDRCTEELKLESVTLEEDPGPLFQAIGLAALRDHPDQAEAVSNEAPSLKRAFVNQPVRRWVAELLLRWTKARVRDRENLRFERTRVFGRVRRIFLAIGKRLAEEGLLAEARDIFFLEVGEALSLVEGTATTSDIRALVAIRKEEATRFEAAGEPPNRFETLGAVSIDLARRPRRGETSHLEAGARAGLGCCHGVVRGTVRVIRDPRKESVAPGEIMVARHTDPGWIAQFSNAAGILVERGSLLSHSAIVAREMNIPAIVAIPNLLEWLRSGDVVEMDGASGRVTVVSAND